MSRTKFSTAWTGFSQNHHHRTRAIPTGYLSGHSPPPKQIKRLHCCASTCGHNAHNLAILRHYCSRCLLYKARNTFCELMTKLKTSIAVLAGLVLIFSPILQMDTAQASMTSSSSDLCGESTCCCCPVDSPASDNESSGDHCQCQMSESNEPPLDVEMTLSENRFGRDLSIGCEAATFDDYIVDDAHGYAKSLLNYHAGKSPPAYLFSCAFLI